MVHFNLQLNNNQSSFEYSFPYDFLDKKYEIGFVRLNGNLESSNSFEINNVKFVYSINGVDGNNNLINEEYAINIPNNNYDLDGLINKINQLLLKRDKNFFKINVKDNNIICEIKNGYTIDFSQDNSLKSIIGFDSKLSTGKHVSKQMFNTNDVFITCNLIDDTYINNKRTNVIYRFSNNNTIVNVEPHYILYHKVTNRPSKITLSLVDINKNLINFKNVNLFAELHLKEI